MADAIVITRKEGESPNSLYHRFSKQFRSSGIQTFARSNRFSSRKPSKTIRKKDCINRIARREQFEEAYRLGKAPVARKSRRW